MTDREQINQYDLVEIVQVPYEHQGLIQVGDVGLVIQKYDDRNFEVERVGVESHIKWQAALNAQYLRLHSRDPYQPWIKQSLIEKPMMQRSLQLGVTTGIGFGFLLGAGLGAITWSLTGILVGALAGSLLGIVSGLPTAWLTVKIGGTTGGVGVGAYVGMGFGMLYGFLVGMLIPNSLRLAAHTENLALLDAFSLGRFETALFISFLFAIHASMVGSWVGGVNFLPREVKGKGQDE